MTQSRENKLSIGLYVMYVHLFIYLFIYVFTHGKTFRKVTDLQCFPVIYIY